MVLRTVLPAALLVSCCSAQNGPGRGPWQTATPESQGLSTAELDAAEARANAAGTQRDCHVVIKNGYIVHETYYSGRGPSSTRAAASVTKSLCSSLYGIATEQGWADPTDLIRNRNAGTLSCNGDAQFRHSLTMTGTSPDITNPRFSYDTLGTQCLDTLQYFIGQNNPDGLSATAWKDRYYADVLGWEHTSWGGILGLQCGFSATMSCRDMARAGQLWVNEGAWPGAGQVMSRQHAIDGRRWTFPASGTQYGYTVWLRTSDPVDNEVSSMLGAGSQCVHMSKAHETVVISMGNGGSCDPAWNEFRHAIVSKDHPLKNQTHAMTAAERAEAEKHYRYNY